MESSEIVESQAGPEGISLDLVTSSFAAIIEYGKAGVTDIIGSHNLKSALDAAGDFGEELASALKVVNRVRMIASIPDKLFMKKVEKYINGLIDIPLKQREKYAWKVGKDSLNKDGVFILGILNKTEELEKIDFLVKLFEAKLFEIIDDQTYRRMMLQVDRTMYSDILYLRDNICSDGIRISSCDDEAANLLSTGWLTLDGLYWGSADEAGGYRYKYTQTAKKFCKIIFNKII